jgi:hypothetical protein
MKPSRRRAGARILGTAAIAALPLLGTAIAANAAPAATGLADGSITVSGSTCTWANATTSDTAPNTLTIDHTTVSPSCGGSISASLTNDPTVTFDDTAGTASSAEVDVTATVFGVNCAYSVTNLGLARSGSTRTYSGGPFTANLKSGSFLCPGSESVDSATLTFH